MNDLRTYMKSGRMFGPRNLLRCSKEAVLIARLQSRHTAQHLLCCKKHVSLFKMPREFT
ncbi:uncharacterized protein FOMMEDRAFT_20491 [Fomitiporia mediterranea MF3/22]|uniref:uncharacterized protein n=1 Tax=Fomitiporia mediterranea (strain MF3/22) TaxID=694068 RepID=UPI0004409290|nr:uncharacterized protein FOMMEDRAFT_20491 [Fomitiporia mediterranea MF3/22]EJD03387.1 hypothetical protein FOMMEDRAFT_20491 [Fomitiporia mediterranea MF3/22]